MFFNYLFFELTKKLFQFQTEEERQAQLRERARKLLADVRRYSGPTTEIIRVSPESLKAYVESEGKRLGDDVISSDKLDNKGKSPNLLVDNRV